MIFLPYMYIPSYDLSRHFASCEFYVAPARPSQRLFALTTTSACTAMVRSIQRTAVPVWSPSTYPSTTPLLATGTVSGALDASFSSDSVLELWDPYGGTQHEQEEDALELSPVASLNVGSRFNRLAWGYVKYPERPRGVIAAGLENGEIALWDPSVMLGNKSSSPE